MLVKCSSDGQVCQISWFFKMKQRWRENSFFFFLFVGWSWLTDIFDIFVEIATCLILWNSTHIDLCFKFKSLISSLQMRLEPQRQRRPFPTKFCLLDLRLLLCLKQKFNKQWLSIVSYEKSHSAKKFLHKTISISGQSSQFNI